MAETNDNVQPAPLPQGMQYSSLIQRAVPAEVNRRSFIPSSGSEFNETANNIRIPLSVPLHHFIDMSNSYLQYTIKATCTNDPSATAALNIVGTVDLTSTAIVAPTEKKILVSQSFYANLFDGMKVKYSKGSGGTAAAGLTDGGDLFVVTLGGNQVGFTDKLENVYKYLEAPKLDLLVGPTAVATGGTSHTFTVAPGSEQTADIRNRMSMLDIFPGVIIDGGATSVFQDCSIVGPDGTILEETRNLNLVSDVHRVMTSNKEYAESYGHLTCGVPSSTKDSAARIRFAKDGTSGSGLKTLCCNLPMAFFNQSGAYCPAGFISGAPLTISLTLAPVVKCLKSLGTVTGLSYSINNVKFVAQTVLLDSTTTSTFQSLMESVGGIQTAGKSYFNVTNTHIPSGSDSVQSVTVPARVRSLNCLVTAMYDGASQVSQPAFSITNRVARKISQVHSSIGGTRYPTSPILISATNQGEAINEMLKCRSMVGDNRATGMLRSANGVGDATIGNLEADAYYPSDGSDNFCSFFITQNFKDFAGDESVESGMNLSSQTSNIVSEYHLTTTASTQLYSWAYCDVIFTYLSSGVVAASI